jgi:hypothetical protein
MERQLFDWEVSNGLGGCHMLFGNCTLKVNVGPHKVGTKFKSIYVNFDGGKIVIYSNDGKEKWTYNLKIAPEEN